MKHVLPFALDAPSISYHNKAFPLGVMKANLKNFDIWMCNKLIQCVYEHGYDRYNLFDEDIWSCQDNVTATQSFHVFPEIFRYPSFDILGIVKDMLDHGYYAGGLNNEKYVRAKKAYQAYDHVHDYIIFGYDDEKSVFKSAGYVANQKYEYFDLYYDDYIESLKNFCFKRMAIFFHRIDGSVEPVIKIDEIKRKTEDYLLSRKNKTTVSAADLYGISVWRKLASHFANLTEDKYPDIRASRAMLEHKTIMLDRIRLLAEMNFIPDACKAYEEAVVQPSYIAYMLCLKFTMTEKRELLQRIAELIEQICLDEEQILKGLFLNG